MAPETANALLERDRELEEITIALDCGLAGAGGVLAIEGPAGIGKTALLGEALRAGERKGMLVLGARGIERERDFPFGVVRQLFEPALRGLNGATRDSVLSGAASLAAPVVWPHVGGDESPKSESPLLHGLYWIVANLSQRTPLVLGVDDIHWSDGPSLSFAAYLSQRLQGLPVVLAVTVRTTDEEARSEDVQALLDATPARLEPRPLSPAAVADLVSTELANDADEDFCRACHAATGGNPFFVRELLLELGRHDVQPTSEGARLVRKIAPAPARRAVVSRVDRLSQDAAKLVKGLAVIGDPAELRQAAALVGLDHDSAANAADGLVAAGILAPDRPLAFRHPIIRAAIYENLAAADRASMHARAADLLAAEGAPPERCAVHLVHTDSRGDAEVVEVLRAAARRALSRGAAEPAASYLRRALVEPPKPERRITVLHELGAAELRAGDVAAIERLEQALDHTTDPRRRAPIALELARGHVMEGNLAAAVELLDRERAVVSDHDRESALRLEGESLSLTLIGRGPSAVAHERIEAARTLAGETRGERAVLAAIAPPLSTAGDTPATEIAELCRRALGNGELLAEITCEGPQFVLAAQELGYADDLEAAGHHLDQGIDDARRRGSALGFYYCSAMRGMVAHRGGDLVEALSLCAQAVEVGRAHRWVAAIPTGPALYADALIDRGELVDAAAVLAEAEVTSEPVTQRSAVMMNQALYRRGVLSLARGDPEAAVRQLLDLDARKRQIGDVNPGRHPWLATLVLALHAAGDLARAREYVDQTLERARRWGTKSALGIALRASAVVEAGEARTETLREAVAALADSPARLEHARALLDLGVCLADAGHREEARDQLRQALDLAHRCGATPMAETARARLVAAGGRPRRPRATGADALTPSERRVAEMAASGMSNPEIAQALFLTRKTIETHLSSAYGKLGIHSRERLPESLR